MEESVNVIEMKIPTKPEYIGIVRLAVSGIASRMSFPYEDIEDVKIAVAEACIKVIQNAYCNNDISKGLRVRCLIDKSKLAVEIMDKAGCISINNDSDSELGTILIKNLMDKVECEELPNEGRVVRMIKYLSR